MLMRKYCPASPQTLVQSVRYNTLPVIHPLPLREWANHTLSRGRIHIDEPDSLLEVHIDLWRQNWLLF